MGTKSTQFRTRGDYDGENTSGKSGVSWNTAQLGTAAIYGIEATGGAIEDKVENGKKYRIHMFGFAGYNPTGGDPGSPYYAASPPTGWTFVVSNAGALGGNIHYQVIGGGGGSGYPSSGGGGAGGFRTNFPGVVTDPTAPGGSVPLTGAAYPVSAGTYVCKVGTYGMYAGGAGSPAPNLGGMGEMSEFYPSGQSFPHASYIRAYGGGAGTPSNYPSPPASPTAVRGSGGGGGYQDPTGGPASPGPAADPNHPIIQGYPGGSGPTGDYGGGGGGGAGAAGANATPTGNGNGGTGVISGIYPSPPTINSGNGFYWCGGGGGSAETGKGGDGGTGGGGGGGGPSPGGPTMRGGGSTGSMWPGGGSYSGGASGHGRGANGGGGGGSLAHPGGDGRHGYGARGSIIIRYEIAMNQPL